jgi:hypothetical protein
MAAGLGFKTFTTGEVLTAGDVNGYLMQGINVFATTTARNAAITAPAEGQFAFTKDTNSLWYYDGAAWVASGATGDIEGVTAGVGISGGGTSGTVTITNSMATAIDAKGDLVAGTAADTFARLPIGTNGFVLTADSGETTGMRWGAVSAPSSGLTFLASSSPSAAASVTFDSVFSNTYQSYLVVGVLTGSADAGVQIRFRTGGTDDSNTSYSYTVLFNDTSSVSGTGGATGQTSGKFTNSGSSGTSVFSSTILNPFASAPTGYMTNQARFIGGSQARCDFYGGFNTNTSFDGFKLYPDSGTFTGTIRVYGLANS